jgi:hypothetical protein
MCTRGTGMDPTVHRRGCRAGCMGRVPGTTGGIGRPGVRDETRLAEGILTAGWISECATSHGTRKRPVFSMTGTMIKKSGNTQLNSGTDTGCVESGTRCLLWIRTGFARVHFHISHQCFVLTPSDEGIGCGSCCLSAFSRRPG